jgi:hypothetical protein
MKHIFISISFIILLLMLVSCSDDAINNITFQNMADGDVIVSFRGETVEVPSGQVIQIADIDKGEFEYETIYSIPAGATSAAAEGEMSGTFELRAGTKILVVYTSVLAEGAYTIYASLTSSEDVNYEGEIDPIGP